MGSSGNPPTEAMAPFTAATSAPLTLQSSIIVATSSGWLSYLVLQIVMVGSGRGDGAPRSANLGQMARIKSRLVSPRMTKPEIRVSSASMFTRAETLTVVLAAAVASANSVLVCRSYTEVEVVTSYCPKVLDAASAVDISPNVYKS